MSIKVFLADDHQIVGEGLRTLLEKQVYIQDLSDTEFTHGICPECFKKLYPDETLEDL